MSTRCLWKRVRTKSATEIMADSLKLILINEIHGRTYNPNLAYKYLQAITGYK